MKWIHIVAGLLALAAGATALVARKGSPLHRRAGQVFVGAMWVMCGSAALMAAFISPNRVNVVAALLTFHLVTTGWLVLHWPVERYRGWLAALMLLALGVGLRALGLGLEALELPRGVLDKVPAPPIFLFAVVGISAGLLDARLLWAGHIAGTQRLVRHLWRMGFAMFVASASFFLGQAKFFPDPLRKTALLAIPVLLVIATVTWWLVRVLWKGRRGRQALAG